MFILAGAVALAFSAIDRLKSFAGWGFAAEMREVQRAAKEVSATASEVRALALPLIRIALSSAIAATEQATRLLNSMGATDEERFEVLQNGRRGSCETSPPTPCA